MKDVKKILKAVMKNEKYKIFFYLYFFYNIIQLFILQMKI